MYFRGILLCGLILFVIGGCSHHPKQTGESDWAKTGKSVVASSIEDFEKEARRMCPYGYDILGETRTFIQGKRESHVIRCRMAGS